MKEQLDLLQSPEFEARFDAAYPSTGGEFRRVIGDQPWNKDYPSDDCYSKVLA